MKMKSMETETREYKNTEREREKDRMASGWTRKKRKTQAQKPQDR